jgi:hypothetical protein
MAEFEAELHERVEAVKAGVRASEASRSDRP